MKFFNGSFCCLLLLCCFCFRTPAQTGYFGTYFTQTASPANVGPYGATLLNNTALNGDSSKIIIFGSVFGSATPYDFYNTVNFGLQYFSPQWGIYQEDGDTVPYNSQFNVLVASMNGEAFIHTADSANIDSNYTVLDDSAINNNPNALLFISHNYNPDNNNDSTDCDHTLGVFYNPATGNWNIYNDDSVSPFIPNTQFNVFAVEPGPNAFLQVADTTNTFYYITYIDNPFLNGNPYATLFAIYNLNAAGHDGFNQSQIEVWYDPTVGQWAIYNVQADDSIYAGSAFNVLIADNIPTGISNMEDEYQLSLYPNPASTYSYLKYELGEPTFVKIDLLDCEGRETAPLLQAQQETGPYSLRVTLSSLAPGVYFCKFSVDGKIITKTVFKQ